MRPESLPDYLVPLRDALVDARREGQSISLEGLPVPRSDADAYAVQTAVADACGFFASSRPRAWKVGAASRAAVPNAAPLPPRYIVRSPATFAAGTFNRILIEGEIAFRLRAPLGDAAADPASVAAAIGEWLVTIEVVDPRYANLDDAGPTLRLADHGMHGALVVGGGGPLPDAVDWTSLVARVRRNGELVKETRGGHPLGNLLFLLPWLARHAAECGVTLGDGDVVTAGTWTGVVEAFPGETIDVEFPAIGRASACFE
ncbi:MAG TPA: fumarylacetoacetate hydrolase family protein [Casimicrobiaceae bacterium]|nr:fumarylacetoacetate hydrolase family protein [Casimicrobiaceae bacterium]